MEQVALLDQPLITSLLSHSKNYSLFKTLYTASTNLAWPRRKYRKITIFGIFQFYHVTSNGHISAIFWKYGLKYFLEPLNMLYLQNRKKNWGTLSFKYCF